MIRGGQFSGSWNLILKRGGGLFAPAAVPCYHVAAWALPGLMLWPASQTGPLSKVPSRNAHSQWHFPQFPRFLCNFPKFPHSSFWRHSIWIPPLLWNILWPLFFTAAACFLFRWIILQVPISILQLFWSEFQIWSTPWIDARVVWLQSLGQAMELLPCIMRPGSHAVWFVVSHRFSLWTSGDKLQSSVVQPTCCSFSALFLDQRIFTQTICFCIVWSVFHFWLCWLRTTVWSVFPRSGLQHPCSLRLPHRGSPLLDACPCLKPRLPVLFPLCSVLSATSVSDKQALLFFKANIL